MNIVNLLFLLILFALVHAYVLYPFLAVLFRGRGELAVADTLPCISVLVPAHNEATEIEAKIENFKAIDYPHELIELVIGDDGSTDNTAALVRKHESDNIRLLELKERGGKASAMNQMVEATTSSCLLFSDANVMFSPNVVHRLVGHLSNPDVGAVTGEVRLMGSHKEFSAGEELYYQMERQIQHAESRLGSVMGVDGGMFLIRRNLFNPLPLDTILDDLLISIRVMRAGKRVVYEKMAKANESGTASSGHEFSRRARIAAGVVQLLKRRNIPRWNQPLLWYQFLSHKVLRWFSPILLVVCFVLNIILVAAGWGPFYVTCLAGQILIFGLILLAWGIPKMREKSIFGVLFYFGLSQTAMLVGLVRGLFNRQSTHWATARSGDNSKLESK